jgi:hypothetical protein
LGIDSQGLRPLFLSQISWNNNTRIILSGKKKKTRDKLLFPHQEALPERQEQQEMEVGISTTPQP